MNGFNHHMNYACREFQAGSYTLAVQRCREAIEECMIHILYRDGDKQAWESRMEWARAVESEIHSVAHMRELHYRVLSTNERHQRPLPKYHEDPWFLKFQDRLS